MAQPCRHKYSQDLAELVELLQGLAAPTLLLVTATSRTQWALKKPVVPAAGIPAVQFPLQLRVGAPFPFPLTLHVDSQEAPIEALDHLLKGSGSGKEQDAPQGGVDLFPQSLRPSAHKQAQASPLLQKL